MEEQPKETEVMKQRSNEVTIRADRNFGFANGEQKKKAREARRGLRPGKLGRSGLRPYTEMATVDGALDC